MGIATVAFDLDFNTNSASGRIDSLIAKLSKLEQATNKAARGLELPASVTKSVKEHGDELRKLNASVASFSREHSKMAQKVSSDNASMVKSAKAYETSATKSYTTVAQARAAADAKAMASQQALTDMAKANAAAQAASYTTVAQARAAADAKAAAQIQAVNARLKATNEARQQRELQLTQLQIAKEKELARVRAAQVSQRVSSMTQMPSGGMNSAKQSASVWVAQEAQVKRYNAALAEGQTIIANSQKAQNGLSGAVGNTTKSHVGATQATAAFRASLAATGAGIGIYTSGTIVAAAATYAFIAGLRQTLTIGSEFEASMYRVYAVTGQMGTVYEENGRKIVTTSQEIAANQKLMEETAREAAKTTIFTARESAEGMVALGMAGLTAKQSVGALKPSLDLANIGMISVYESADIMTNVMLGFGMSVEGVEDSLASATLVSDVLAASITNSNATISEMAKALSYVAPIAHASGASIYEVTAAIETFHNVGIKGQRAGTGLRRAFVNLQGPTRDAAMRLHELNVNTHDAEGGMLPLIDIMQQLEDAGAGVSDLAEIFGVRALAAMTAYKNNLQEIRDETERLKTESQGVSAAMAEFMATGVSQQWKLIRSKFEDNFLSSYEQAEPQIRELNQALMELATDQDVINGFKLMGQLLGTISSAAATIIEARGDLTSAALIGAGGDAKDMYGINMIAEGLASIDLTSMLPDDLRWFFDKLAHDQEVASKAQQEALRKQEQSELNLLSAQERRRLSQEKLADSQVKLSNQTLSKTQAQLEAELQLEKSKEQKNRALEQARSILEDQTAQVQAQAILSEAETANKLITNKEQIGMLNQFEAGQIRVNNLAEARARTETVYAQEIGEAKKKYDELYEAVKGGRKLGEDLIKQAQTVKKLEDQRDAALASINSKLIVQGDAFRSMLTDSQSISTLLGERQDVGGLGLGDMAEEADKLATSLTVATEKLRGNKEASYEVRIANLEVAQTMRERFQESQAFTNYSALEQAAYMAETEAGYEQIMMLKLLLEQMQKVRAEKEKEKEDKKAKKEADRTLRQLKKDFSRGRGLGDEAAGEATYKADIKRLQDYWDNRLELEKEYGVSALELKAMLAEAEKDIEEEHWDFRFSKLAEWRDAVTASVGAEVAAATLGEQHWSESVQRVSATMVGAFANITAQWMAERAFRFMMEEMFTTQEMALNTAKTANTVTNTQIESQAVAAAEGVKATAKTATAAAEGAGLAAMGPALVSGLSPLIGVGTSLALAWAPAAMYVNIASFGLAGLLAAGTMTLAGGATAAAGLAAGGAGMVGGAAAGVGGLVGGAGGAMSGSRQSGGPVYAGNSYLVGETGRELFTPTTNGYITNNQDLSSQTSNSSQSVVHQTNHYNIDASGNADVDEKINKGIERAVTMSRVALIKDLQGNGDVRKLVKTAARS